MTELTEEEIENKKALADALVAFNSDATQNEMRYFIKDYFKPVANLALASLRMRKLLETCLADGGLHPGVQNQIKKELA